MIDLKINPLTFQQALSSLLSTVKPTDPHNFIPIDGKTIRRSHDSKNGQHPLHMLSMSRGMTLGQAKTSGKGNVLKGIEKILDLIDIRNSTVIIDVLGCQKKIAEKIVKNGANYIF